MVLLQSLGLPETVSLFPSAYCQNSPFCPPFVVGMGRVTLQPVCALLLLPQDVLVVNLSGVFLNAFSASVAN